MLDVGTDNEELLNDPLYLGMRHRRIRGAGYQAFVDRFVDAVTRVYPGRGAAVGGLPQGATPSRSSQRFRDRLCTFNDDIQGTAAIVVAGIYAALRITRAVDARPADRARRCRRLGAGNRRSARRGAARRRPVARGGPTADRARSTAAAW